MSSSQRSHFEKFVLLLIGLGLLLRWSSAFLSNGFEHPNEVYRLLEPLAWLDGYPARLPWEWKEGLLSYLPVLAHRALLHAAIWVGISSPGAQALLLRLLYGTLSMTQAWAAYRLCQWGKASRSVTLLAVGFVSLWPEFVYRSVRLMDYSLEASLLAIAVLLALRARAAWAGVVMGLSFFVRILTGLEAVSLAALVAIAPGERKWRRLDRLSKYAVAYLATIAALALLESRMHGSFLSPAIQYFEYNWSSSARDYGADPWHRTFTEAAKLFGFAPFLAFVWLSWRERKRSWPASILFWLPFLAHTIAPHKEGRFLYGFAWTLVPGALCAWAPRRLGRLATAGAAALLLIGLAAQAPRIAGRFLTGAFEVKDFIRIGRKLHGTFPPPPALIIEGDPDFLPGSFFLRADVPICYRYAGKEQGTCSGFDPGKAWRIVLGKGGGWELRK